MAMRLQLPDGSFLPVPADGVTLGRGTPACWVDPSLSRQQVRLSVLPDLPGVLKLHNIGINAVLVESRAASGGPWELREVLDQGMETLVDASSRFYLISRLDTTLVTVHPAAPAPAHPPGDLERPAKRLRQADEGQAEAQPPGPQQQQQQQQQQPVQCEAAFQLLAVRELGAETAACGAVGLRLREVVEAGVRLALVSNYMVDLPWLLSACPALLAVEQMVVVHGEHGEREAALRKAAADAGIAGFTAHRPPLPIAYGTHHSKAFLLAYPAGLRVLVHTANLIYPDCNNKAQGLWHQDFPPKTAASPRSSEFEAALTDYLAALSLPAACAGAVMAAVRRHDFSGASACLVPSVPGYHTGAALQRYGHMCVRSLLAQEELAEEWRGAPVVAQCSSLGSLDEAWLLGEFGASLAAGRYPRAAGAQVQGAPSAPAQLPRLAPQQLQIVWPTVEEVRGSVEGWAAGYSIPGNQKNVGKLFLQRHWHRYSGTPVGRSRAMPHIKTYTRYIGQRLAWVLLTSHNLSKAAWGALQKGQRQLMVRSYELGVLLLPSRAAAAAAHPSHGFCCTPHDRPCGSLHPAPVAHAHSTGTAAGCSNAGSKDGAHHADGSAASGASHTSASALELVSWEHMRSGCADPTPEQASSSTGPRHGGNRATRALAVPLPFPVPPVRYTASDRPWMCDVQYPGLDRQGRPCGSPWQFYGLLDSD